MRIDSNARTIRLLLANTKYQLDYYQREYSWQTQHVLELINDLTSSFYDSYEENHERTQVPNYGHYFLGSIIISHSGNQMYIVDGQQRLTTLTLLLIRIYHLLKDDTEKNRVVPLIYSLSQGIEGFNLDVPEWKSVMEFLYSDKPDKGSFDVSDQPESIHNIVERYNDIEKYFEIQEQAFLHFVDWLIENVDLVTISAFNSRDAYAIFETVNDRGLSLTPSDMLRGYLLSSITDPGRRDQASEIWRDRSQTLKQIGKGEESEAIKAWLRSQYVGILNSSESVQDFDAIGSEFHRWVRDQRGNLGLESPHDFANFIERDFEFYTAWYCRLRDAANSRTDALKHGLECVYYNAQHNKFTIQYPILLAPLHVDNSDAENLQKVQIVAGYLDILIYRRIWNLLPIAQRTMADLMPPVIPTIRGKSCSELRDILYTRLQTEVEPFANNRVFGFQGVSRHKIFLILARMTDYVGVQSEESSRYSEYMKTGRNRYEIEHIWADHFEHHMDEFSYEPEFEAYRNRIGGLLLLPKSVNASIGDDPYSEKRKVYAGQNLLAKSLTEQAYRNNPGFIRFKENSGLPFRKHSEFKKPDLDTRQELYLKLADRIWNPEQLRETHGEESEIIVGPENPHGNLGKGDKENEQTVEEPLNEDDQVEIFDLEGKDMFSDAEEISAIEPIMDEIRKFYKTESNAIVNALCTRMTELLNLIEAEGWNGLTFETRKLYCGFYLEGHPVFGVFLFKDPQFVVWMDAEDVEKLKGDYEFKYERSRRHVYLQHTITETLQPIFEFAYKKVRGY